MLRLGTVVVAVMLAAGVGSAQHREPAAGDVMADLEVATLTIEKDRRIAALAKHPVGALAPGTTLVFFHVRPFGLTIPFLGSALDLFCRDHGSLS